MTDSKLMKVIWWKDMHLNDAFKEVLLEGKYHEIHTRKGYTSKHILKYRKLKKHTIIFNLILRIASFLRLPSVWGSHLHIYPRSQKTMACEPNPACHLLLQIKFYWNTFVHKLSLTAFTTMTELSIFNRNHVAHKPPKYFLFGSWQKKLTGPCVLLIPPSFTSRSFLCLSPSTWLPWRD